MRKGVDERDRTKRRRKTGKEESYGKGREERIGKGERKSEERDKMDRINNQTNKKLS